MNKIVTCTGQSLTPKGIGGWLLLPTASTILVPILTLKSAVDLFSALQNEMTATIRGIIIFEAAFTIALLAGWIVACVKLFKHKRSFPILFVALMGLTVFSAVIDLLVGVYLGVRLVGDDFKSLAQGLIAIAIWTPYMYRSVRVRNTFVVD